MREAISYFLPVLTLVGRAENAALGAEEDDAAIPWMNGDRFNEIITQSPIADFKMSALIN